MRISLVIALEPDKLTGKVAHSAAKPEMRAKSSTAITQRQTRCIFETESDHPWPVSDDKDALVSPRRFEISSSHVKLGFKWRFQIAELFLKLRLSFAYDQFPTCVSNHRARRRVQIHRV